MNKYGEALEAVREAEDCFQPETLEELRKHFPIIKEIIEIYAKEDLRDE